MKPIAALAAVLLATGCASIVVSQPMMELDRTRASAGAKEGEQLAPQQFRHAEDLRALALAAHEKGDVAGADLYAERALVAYQRALVLARIARAGSAASEAADSLAARNLEMGQLAAARVPFDEAADVTANALATEREALPTAKSGPADPARERARVVAAQSLAAEARLLCGAARLLSPTVSGLEGAEHEVEALNPPPGTAPPHANADTARPAATIDAAARARAGCLAVLTRARREDASARVDDADALLSELSQHGGWEPSRDERGIVVTLRGAYAGNALTKEADRELQELGRVAASHSVIPVQVVLHDATPPSPSERAADAQRLVAATTALTAGGEPVTHTSAEAAGARLPVVDPLDPRARARNARLDVVFVSHH